MSRFNPKNLPVVTRLKEAPVVGKWYRVPAIRFDRTMGASRPHEKGQDRWPVSYLPKVLWWPVMGRMHDDVDHFDFHHKHYHIDLRFVGNRHLAQAGQDWGIDDPKQAKLACLSTSPLHGRHGQGGLNHLAKPVLMPFRMMRDHQPWMYHDRPRMQDFQDALSGQKCRHSKAGWVCPHRGYPLGQVTPDANGVVTCPLHGLRINAQTGMVLAAHRSAQPAHSEGKHR